MSQRSVTLEKAWSVIHHRAERVKTWWSQRRGSQINRSRRSWSGLEPLEQRVLLSGTLLDSPLDQEHRDAIVGGLATLSNWADTLDGLGQLAQDLPGIGDSVGQLLDSGGLLADRLADEVQGFITSFPDTLNTSDLVGFLDGLADTTGVVEGGFDDMGNDLVFRLVFEPTRNLNLNLDLTEFDFESGQASISGTAGLTMDFTFGVDLTPGLTASEAFFIEVNQLSAGLDLAADFSGSPVSANLGLLGVDFQSGMLDLDAMIEVAIQDPDGSGQVTVSELLGTSLESLVDLTPTASLDGSVQLGVTSSFFPISGTPTVTVTDANLFDATPIDVDFNSDGLELVNFKNISEIGFAGLIEQLGAGDRSIDLQARGIGGDPVPRFNDRTGG